VAASPTGWWWRSSRSWRSAAGARLHTEEDGWTLRTRDGAVAVQEEHTAVIRDGRPLVLTAA
jgi:methionyl aminopeptidase